MVFVEADDSVTVLCAKGFMSTDERIIWVKQGLFRARELPRLACAADTCLFFTMPRKVSPLSTYSIVLKRPLRFGAVEVSSSNLVTLSLSPAKRSS